MRFNIDAQSSDDYGDYATIRIHFSEDSWIEVQAADAWDLNQPNNEAKLYGQGATITIHHADGTEEIAWNDRVMPPWYAKRQRERAAQTAETPFLP